MPPGHLQAGQRCQIRRGAIEMVVWDGEIPGFSGCEWTFGYGSKWKTINGTTDVNV